MTSSAEETTVLLVAYTGTAAFQIGGQTIHSAFAIHCETKSGKYQPLGEEILTTLRCKYRNLQILIIDEVSMVGQNMFMFINERLKQIKQNQTIFGGVSVLAVGDFYQIPPVADRALYNSDRATIYETPWKSFKVWNLVKIMRQREDLSFAEVLNKVREKSKESKLSDSDKEILQSRCVCTLDAPQDVLHIYPRNKDVDEFNSQQLEKCKNAVTITAADVVSSKGVLKKRSHTSTVVPMS